jgi:hypothetical protein
VSLFANLAKQLAAEEFALLALANARSLALEMPVLESVRLLQRQLPQQQQQPGLVKVRRCHRKVGRVHFLLGWILNFSKCATKLLAVAVAPNP